MGSFRGEVDVAALGPRRLTALVVDDSAPFREFLLGLLRDSGWSAEVAASGLEALTYLRERKYDLITMDLTMPGMSGVETMARLREFDEETPVVVITGYIGGRLIDEARALGPIAILRKPLDSEEFIALLNRLEGS